MIKPTIGRRVWYWPSDYERGFASGKPQNVMAVNNKAQPCDAGIAYVHSDRMVNLTVADHNGVMHSRTSVVLMQGDQEDPPRLNGFAEWMPYQVGQAKPAT